MTSIIGLTGFRSSGKGEVARVLNAEGFATVKFAGPLKDMLRSIGLTEDHIEGRLKELPCDILCGRSPRHAMQTLGTEWGRNMIGDGIWVNSWRARVLQHEFVVVDDCRFPNEANMIHSMGGEIWRITRPGFSGDSHESESHQIDCDAEIINDADIPNLEACTRGALFVHRTSHRFAA